MSSASTVAKKAGAATMALAVAVAMCPALALAFTDGGQQAEAQAPTKMTVTAKKKSAKNLKQRGVKFDLKKGKWRTFKITQYWDKDKYKARVKSVKISKAKEAGYKKAVIEIEVKIAKVPSQSYGRGVAKRMSEANPHLATAPDYYVVDFATGENLRYSGNSQDVQVEGSWKGIKQTKRYRYKGYSVSFLKSEKVSVTVIYPKTYKNVAVGVGAEATHVPVGSGNSDYYSFNNNDQPGRWYKATGFKQDIKNYHFTRIK